MATVDTVTRWIGLLRGVNVGGHTSLSMKELRGALAERGLEGVATYLQSGNVAFDSDLPDEAAVAAELASCIADRFGTQFGVVVRTGEEIASVIAANPFADQAAADPRLVVVAFFGEPVPSLPAVPDDAPEGLHLDGRHLYLWYPEGQGRSKLDRRFWGKLPATCLYTARNWRTVEALREL